LDILDARELRAVLAHELFMTHPPIEQRIARLVELG
jgi:Zn-dependent protease with chaperone function